MNTQELAGPDSYKNRVWTRAEQMLHCSRKDVASMYMYNDGKLARITEDWMHAISCIFEGEMTCCRLKHPDGGLCDRQSLVPAMLGLYHDVYTKVKHTHAAAEQVSTIWTLIRREKERMFPRYFVYESSKIACQNSDFHNRRTQSFAITRDTSKKNRHACTS